MAFELPSLPYDYSALEPIIDQQTMQLHHGKHHAGYVEKLNAALSGIEGNDKLLNMDIAELLASLEQIPENIRTAVRNNGGGHANHSLFWEIMRPSQENNTPEGKVAESINATFGNFEQFKKQFSEQATGIFGSGWAWLTVSNNKLNIQTYPNQDSPIINQQTPILGLDVWEHAYYLKYQNRRAEYVENWWKLVNWPKVEELYTKTLAS